MTDTFCAAYWTLYNDYKFACEAGNWQAATQIDLKKRKHRDTCPICQAALREIHQWGERAVMPKFEGEK